jgi:demethylmenaquinone methyltransferase/2-methoxy-6-polyprenyl-1,4-benzoquinol methylase
MFASIAGTYDVLNHVLSLNQDKGWRRFAAKQLQLSPGDRVLDACTGTADFAVELAGLVGAEGHVIGTDFCEEMVRLGVPKVGELPIDLGVADTLALPFVDNSFQGVTVGFGIRNVVDLAGGIRELVRVTKPGGRIAILECTQPGNPLFRFIYYVYFLIVLPVIGNLVAGGKQNAYGYLPRSVLNFPNRTKLKKVCAENGMLETRVHSLSLGIVTVHVGHKGA